MDFNLTFGDLNGLCAVNFVSLCNLDDNLAVVEQRCIPKSLLLGEQAVMTNAADVFLNIVIVLFIAVLMYMVNNKRAAVGRVEMLIFLAMYILATVVQLIIDAGFDKASFLETPERGLVYLSAAHVGIIVTIFWMLIYNGFLAFQWIVDGGFLSLMLYLGSSAVIFAGTVFGALDIHLAASPLSAETKNSALFALYFLWPPIACVIYGIASVVLVLTRLDTKRPILWVLSGLAVFALAQLVAYPLNVSICEIANTAADGNIFANFLVFAAVACLYGYYDSIMEDDYDDYECEI